MLPAQSSARGVGRSLRLDRRARRSQLIATLESLVSARPDAAELSYSPFHAKGSGRAIPIVTIGHGDRGMMIIANQHGDEYVVSNSAVEIIRALTRNSSWARSVRDELTITIMPRVNIDGFDANPSGSPWRVNVDPNVCPTGPCPAFYTRGRGYDINRYHSYLLSDPLDEALAVRAAYDAAGGPDVVEVAMDLHHQGTPLERQRRPRHRLDAVAERDALVLAPDNASLFGKCLAPREYTLENYNFCREKLGLDPVSTLPPQEAMPDDDEASFDGNGWASWSTE